MSNKSAVGQREVVKIRKLLSEHSSTGYRVMLTNESPKGQPRDTRIINIDFDTTKIDQTVMQRILHDAGYINFMPCNLIPKGYNARIIGCVSLRNVSLRSY